MSTVAYKHSLRHHVPSGHSQDSSSPESRKSATTSLKSRGSKREKVKETVDHLLHKFHIPHHHHGHHEHEHSSQDTLQAPVTPEKKSLLAKHASFAASLRQGSLKRKSVVADADVTPTLNYKTSRTLSTSSSFHDDRYSSGSSDTAAEDEPTAVSESPKSSKSSSSPTKTHEAPTSGAISTVAKKTTPILAAAVVEPLSKPIISSLVEHHHHQSNREAIKDAADHVLHKLHIPHHHHSHGVCSSSSFTESTLTSSSSFSAGRSSDESAISAPAVVGPEATKDELATRLPELSVDVDDVFTEPKPPVAVKASEERSLEPLTEVEEVKDAEDATTPAAPVGAVNDEKSVDMIDAPPAVDAPLVEPADLVGSTTQTDDVANIPPQDNIETCLIDPSTQAIPSRKPTYSYTPATIPTYIELRKAAEAHRRAKVEKPSWIRYIYGSFIKPVVVVAVECTVAAVCYGLVKVLERKPRAVSLRSDQLKLA